MIGQRAGALLVGDAKQRSALYAFLRDKLLVDPGCVVGGAVRVDACSARGRRRTARLSRVRARGVAVAPPFPACSMLTSARPLRSYRRCLRASRTPLPCTLRICRSANSNRQRRPAPRSASTVPCARECALPRSRGCVDSDAFRAELASRCCQQLLAVRAMLASVGDGRADESSDLLLAVCPTLLAIPLPEDFRLQTCARLLIAANSPTD